MPVWPAGRAIEAGFDAAASAWWVAGGIYLGLRWVCSGKGVLRDRQLCVVTHPGLPGASGTLSLLVIPMQLGGVQGLEGPAGMNAGCSCSILLLCVLADSP